MTDPSGDASVVGASTADSPQTVHPTRTYAVVPPHIDLPAMEREVLEFWREASVFERSLQQTADGPSWVFFEGPPTANGTPGTHHVEARVFKDLFPRYKTMKGFSVERKAGWDCHGLPVELAVEKKLGFSGKPDIERFGVAEFNAQCRESVHEHVDEFRVMTERMGYWVDLEKAYWTLDPAYVESLWWSIQRIAEKGLLVEDYRVAPYCPRCGTTLSDHELAQGYETVTDPSVYVRFPALDGPLAPLREQTGLPVSLLVWTTTPWTLVSNTAVAVHPEVDYVAVRTGTEVLVVAEPLVDRVLALSDVDFDSTEPSPSVVGRFAGRDLEGQAYDRPFELIGLDRFAEPTAGHPSPAAAHTVVLADYVTTDDGTGLVHQAPAFGAEDLTVGRSYGLPVVNPVRSDGTFEPDIPLVGGEFFKTADKKLVEDLRARGLLYAHVPYEHPYPHCWRCHTALLYYAQPAWYIRTTAIQDALLRENGTTSWYPETIQWGRYGDWLRNNVDWALSRDRYWGTPLPVWRCSDKHVTVIGSLAELGGLAGQDLSNLDPHRPYVDDVTFACPQDGCGAEARRVPGVLDAWYDSGSMPFAQWGYPHVPGSVEKFEQNYPAQFIAEAIDQTRGWFYTLMAVGTLVFDKSSYENVLCLGHIQAEDGRKMSKHLGNILLPMPLMDEHGADALRWFMVASGSPWQPRRIGNNALQEVVRKVLLTYWNTVSFQSLYGRLAGFEPGHTPAPPLAERPLLDRWALSRAHELAREVDAALEDFDTAKAGALLAAYIDDLSNWYVRRSRRRFWDGDPAALATLHESLYVVTLLMAPFVPFTTERVWRDLFASTSAGLPESVHLAVWPRIEATTDDGQLAGHVGLVRRLVELGRTARAESAVRTRQPLGRALVSASGWDDLPAELRAEVADELNVQSLESLVSGEAGAGLVDYTAKGNFRILGKRFAQRTPLVAAAIAAADAAHLAEALRSHGSVEVHVEGEPVRVEADEVLLTSTPREGWAVAADSGETVALDLTITPELRRAGLAREVIRLVQDARKTSGFDISDRIELAWQATDELATALVEHANVVTDDVLATSYQRVEDEVDTAGGDKLGRLFQDEGLRLRFWLQRA